MSRYRELVERGEAATVGTTPGPWGVIEREPDPINGGITNLSHVASHLDWSNPEGILLSVVSGVDDDMDAINAAFVSAARSLVPELVAALREADARIEELTAGLRAFVNHHPVETMEDGGLYLEDIARARAALGVSIQEPETSQK